MPADSTNQTLLHAVTKLKSQIANGEFPDNRQLIEVCKEHFINLIDVKKEPHRIHDILETAVNLYLFENYANTVNENKYETLQKLENLAQKLPTQSWRDGEQMTFQQFSTPPALAFVMCELLKPAKNSVALEPSAGTGSLANWLKIAGCRVEVNEISNRRRQLLELQGYDPQSHNAEFLNDLLDPKIEPDFILMNPPFSASGGRTKSGDTNFGFRHVESALLRLKPGGQLVCLLGAEDCLKTDKGKSFWNRIGKEYVVRSFLVVPAKAFYKHGTTFQTVVIIVDKPSLPQIASSRNNNKPQKIEFCSLNDMLQFSDAFNSTNF
jgi:predicted RNA methylase